MASTAVQPLPADLFHLVFAELASQEEVEGQRRFGTLFNCVVSSKYLASAGAISALYRICHECPIKGGGSEAGQSIAEQDLTVMKWSILWRTIILSAVGSTLYPYCRHLRELDLRDLSDFLDRVQERKFTKVSKQFFAGDLARFHHIFTDTPVRYRAGRLDIKKVLLATGDVLTQQAPLLEGLSEPSSSDVLTAALPNWASRLTHLHELEFWDGKALADESVRNLLRTHCPQLNQLRFHHASGDDADHNIAALLNDMPANRLTHFENISNCGIGTETCLALNSHGASLVSLKLALDQDGMLALGLLQGCTKLRTLAITSQGPSVDLKATQHDVFVDMIGWLGQCDHLVEVGLDGLVSAPDLLLPVVMNKNVQLQDLQIHARENSLYSAKDHMDFHEGLRLQRSLQNLWLRADPEPVSRDEIDGLVSVFCSLSNLQDLNLVRISDFFEDRHIVLLAEHLPNLRALTVGGLQVTDAIWDSLAQLQSLKTLTFSGLTTFTADGLLDYIDKLGPGNAELAITVDMADPDWMIPDEIQDQIRDVLAAKVGGRFEYQPLRDPNIPEFDESDSD